MRQANIDQRRAGQTPKSAGLRQPGLRQRLLPCALACAATLLSLPAVSVEIPDVPLQSGTAYPAPNIMFILDDSGSMDFDAMPADGEGGLDDNIADRSYVHNTIYYNPTIDYKPWAGPEGDRLIGGESFHAVYPDFNMVGGDTIDLADDDSCERVNYNQTTQTVCGGVQTYFVPRQDATDLGDRAEYYRYQIRANGRVVRSEYLLGNAGTEILLSESNLERRTSDSPPRLNFDVVVPADAITLDVVTSGGSGNSQIRVRFDGANVCANNQPGNNRSCTIDDPDAGTYTVRLVAQQSYENVDLEVSYTFENPNTGEPNVGCSTDPDDEDWRECTYVTPTGRSEAEERTNFATWFSYHRTRMKVAKAGASEAFSQLGDSARVGYASIWNRDSYPIPVGNNDGQFSGNNRTDWFEQLHDADGEAGTPLHDALRRAGEYFSDSDSDGPWGPGTGANQISCRQNFAILTTDGYWNSRSRGTGQGRYGGDADSTSGSEITRPEGAPGNPYTYEPDHPFEDNRSDTLADVAMHYWKRDLRTGLDNNVPTSTANPAFWQHMVTFGISIGLQGELNPDTDLSALTDGSLPWPNPVLSNTEGDAAFPSRIDDLWHAAVNSRGQFVAATDPDEFVQGLLDALTTVAERLGSASNVTANSTSFRTDTRVYQASYVSGRWSGHLSAFDASLAGVATDPAWEASQEIPAVDERTILTWNGSGGATFPTTAQEDELERTGIDDEVLVSGTDNAAYIAGDQSLERSNGGTLRNRTTVLGDIANSSPIYVQDNETLFVGANDGMLHAFDALTGEERFAYLPGGIDLTNLATLSAPNYDHKYFVDGPVAVSAQSQTPGRNYLVGALGRGGRGVFGLDVTDPDDFEADDVLWEFSSDNDMGEVLGEPLIVTLNDADNTKAVIVSNGINSPGGSATLFVLDLATGAEIREINTGIAGGNGLSAPRGWDEDGDGTVDYLYAGDLKGNLWKFDFRGDSAADWVVDNDGDPMFTATDDNGLAQPITTGLALARHPDTGARWVFIGTGSFMTTADLTSTDIQSMYGVIDDGSVVDGRTSASDFGDLVDREIVVTGFSDSGQAIRGFEPAVESLESGRKGWFLDLDDPAPNPAAERIVSSPRMLGTVLITASIVPPTGNTCDAGGSGYINALDAFTGASLGQPFFDVDGDGSFDDDDKMAVTVNGETVYVPAGSIDLGVGMPTRPTIIDKLLVVGGSSGSMGSVVVNPQGIGASRISWREILRD